MRCNYEILAEIRSRRGPYDANTGSLDSAALRSYVIRMTVRAQQTANDYRILVEPLNGDVEAWRGDQLLARSSRAKVMYETRLSPVVYFPEEDIRANLIPSEDYNTFCPFKGTASYSDVKIGTETLDRGAWRYLSAMPEGQAVDGHFAFMPDVATKILHRDAPIEALPSGNITGPMVDWLLREAWTANTPEDLISALATTG